MTTTKVEIDIHAVEKLRRIMKLNRGEMAYILDVSRPTYYKYLSGSQPRREKRTDILWRIGKALHLVREGYWPPSNLANMSSAKRVRTFLEMIDEDV